MDTERARTKGERGERGRKRKREIDRERRGSGKEWGGGVRGKLRGRKRVGELKRCGRFMVVTQVFVVVLVLRISSAN